MGASAVWPNALQKNNARSRGEDKLTGFLNGACRTTAWRTGVAGLLGSALLGLVPAHGQGAPSAHPWLDPALLAAAKPDGSLIVYSSTHQQDGLPPFKIVVNPTLF